MRSQRGSGLVEVLVAAALLVGVGLPVIRLAIGSARGAKWGTWRLVAELRARRAQAEVLTTTYDVLVRFQAQDWPVELGDPTDDPEYARCVERMVHRTCVHEVEPGLALAQTTIRWLDPATGNRPRSETVSRLICRPTLALEARYPLRSQAGDGAAGGLGL
jgi:hypothetical protein